MDIISQNAIEHDFLPYLHDISKKSRLTGGSFFKKQSQFLESQMSVSYLFTNDYGNKDDWTPGEKQTQIKPIFGLWTKNRNKMSGYRIKGHNLKKQSQFSGGKNNVKSILTMVYGDFGV
jgi:hypothetical protein